MIKPNRKPSNPCFSSGPCSKRPGYNLMSLDSSVLGRSHRSFRSKQMLAEVIDLTKKLLNIPTGYRVGIVPGSNTGAFEMALWTMLGERGVDVLHWESFGKGWYSDIVNQLKIDDTRSFFAEYGNFPDVSEVDSDRDIIFTYNGTTSGVRVPDCDWIVDNRQGLTFCDATSAVFAMPMPWHKLDITTFSWQKVLGGEAAHGVIVLSPQAIERLESFIPNRPLPKIFRLTQKGKLIEGIFDGSTINTPSMLAVADCLDALKWVESIGGQDATCAIANQNYACVQDFVARHAWIDFLATNQKIASNTSVCLRLDLANEQLQAIIAYLAKHEIGFDIGSYKDAPTGIRIWCGATVNKEDISCLLEWLAWLVESNQYQE